MSLSKWLSSANKLSKKLDFNRQAIIVKIKENPYYRLQSVTEINIAGELGLKIDVNRANIDDWLRLPSISIHQARSLVELTDTGVQFLCLEDLAAALGVSVTRIKIWQPILHFCYYDPESLDTPAKINPNCASLAELQEIPLLDQDLAQKIFINRQEKGNYRNLADLKQRLSLNNDAISQLMYYLKF
jgi:DNA uptake protein ComE-like DNA-binding protein